MICFPKTTSEQAAIMSFLRNQWYVAAWAKEITTDLFHRRILNEHVLIFRRKTGDVAAIGDVCPHHFAPLHMGRLVGDLVQCPYHGLRFDHTGACVENPVGKGKVPKNARVASYKIIERYGLMWIWMGRQELADEGLIPDYSILEDDAWVHATGGYLHCEANYQLMVDNLMDLSHVAFVHPAFGNESMARGELEVERVGDTVAANLWMPSSEVPPYLRDRFDPAKPIDQWLDMKWQAPANLIINYGATKQGSPREQGFTGWGVHFLTPETDMSSHYMFGIMRPNVPGAHAAVASDHEYQKEAFATEDKPMVEACQKIMGTSDFRSLKPILLSCDAAAMRVRAIVEELAKQERTSSQPAVAG
jgi:vanillate O-demethylase monooxygenase subunit